jgi:hypothetical protein
MMAVDTETELQRLRRGAALAEDCCHGPIIEVIRALTLWRHSRLDPEVDRLDGGTKVIPNNNRYQSSGVRGLIV